MTDDSKDKIAHIALLLVAVIISGIFLGGSIDDLVSNSGGYVPVIISGIILLFAACWLFKLSFFDKKK
jgi:high-affinity Fe2+/Pb2+ permease